MNQSYRLVAAAAFLSFSGLVLANPSWELRELAGFKPRDAGGTVVYDGELYLLMGRDDPPGGGYTATGRILQRYDPGQHVLTNLASYPRGDGRYAFGSARVGDQIYVFGGTNVFGNYNTATVDRYSIADDAWTLGVASLPRAGTNNAVAAGGKIYIFGTTAYNGPFTPNVLEFDPSSASFTTRGPVPDGHRASVLVEFNGLIYLIGGNLAGTAGPTDKVQAYHPGTDAWQSLSPLPAPGSSQVGGLHDGRIYVVSGGYDGAPVSDRTYIYDPLADNWSIGAPREVVGLRVRCGWPVCAVGRERWRRPSG